jgi:hypothetical protein
MSDQLPKIEGPHGFLDADPVFLMGPGGANAAAAPLITVGTGAWQEADATLTRPANTTATVAHGAIGSAASCLFKFTNFFDVVGQHGLLTGMKMVIEKAAIAVPSGIAIRMHLYQDDETAVILSSNADAATFKTMAAAAAKKIGYVDFTTWNIGGTGSDCIESYGVPVITSLHLKAGAVAKDLYAIGEATAVFTPINAGIQHLYASRIGV